MFDWSRSEVIKVIDVPDNIVLRYLLKFEWEQDEGSAKAILEGRDTKGRERTFQINFPWARGVFLATQESDFLGILEAKRKFQPFLQPNIFEVLNSPFINSWAEKESIFEVSKEHQRHFLVCTEDELLNVIDTELPEMLEIQHAN